jgi:hypothetical protein
VSTTVNRKTADTFKDVHETGGPGTVLTILVPKGSMAAYVDTFDNAFGDELLLQRGSRFRVMKKKGRNLLVKLLPRKRPGAGAASGDVAPAGKGAGAARAGPLRGDPDRFVWRPGDVRPAAADEGNSTMASKDMNGSSGTEGGYTEGEGDKAMHGQRCKAIKAVMEDSAAPGDQAHYHAETCAVHHVHRKGAGAGYLNHVKDALLKVDGVGEVTQDHEGPGEEGFEQVHPDPAVKPDEVDPPASEDDPGVEKALADAQQRAIRWLTGKAGPRRRKAVRKGDDPKMPPPPAAGESAGEEVPEEEAGPDLGQEDDDVASIVGQLVELSLKLAQMTRQPTPEAPPGEEEDEEEEEEDPQDPEDVTAQEERETEQALDRYRAAEVWRVKHMPHHKPTIKAAADCLHEVAGLDPGRFGGRHKAMCLGHARALDGMHGAMGHEDGDGDGTEAAPMTRDDQPADDGGMDGIDEKAVLAALAPLGARADRLDGALYRATGRRG